MIQIIVRTLEEVMIEIMMIRMTRTKMMRVLSWCVNVAVTSALPQSHQHPRHHQDDTQHPPHLHSHHHPPHPPSSSSSTPAPHRHHHHINHLHHHHHHYHHHHYLHHHHHHHYHHYDHNRHDVFNVSLKCSPDISTSTASMSPPRFIMSPQQTSPPMSSANP